MVRRALGAAQRRLASNVRIPHKFARANPFSGLTPTLRNFSTPSPRGPKPPLSLGKRGRRRSRPIGQAMKSFSVALGSDDFMPNRIVTASEAKSSRKSRDSHNTGMASSPTLLALTAAADRLHFIPLQRRSLNLSSSLRPEDLGSAGAGATLVRGFASFSRLRRHWVPIRRPRAAREPFLSCVRPGLSTC